MLLPSETRDELALDLPADAAAPRIARDAVRLFVGWEAPAVLAVSEAVTNAVVHAYRGGPPGAVRVRARWTAEGLEIVVEDDGVGIWARPDSPGLGIGLPTIATIAERFEIDGPARGTRVTMVFAAA